MSLVRDPIYRQLNQALRDLIASGKFRAGEQFLTERQIAEQFGVSRATANKALASLVSEGTLEFRKGIGTFVRGGVLDYELRTLVSFTDRARTAGRVPTTEVLEFRRMTGEDVQDELRQRLQIAPGESLFYIERLRLADQVPMIFERRHIVARWCDDLTAEAVAGSLYGLWVEKYHLEITGAEQAVRAVNLAAPDAKLLGGRAGVAALRVLALGLVGDRKPLWWEDTLYRADSYEFLTRLGGLTINRSSIGLRMRDGRGE